MSAARKSAVPAKPAAAKGSPMCRVTIGYENFLLPAALGLKLMGVMATAVQLETDWAAASSLFYKAGPVRLAYHSALPGDIAERPAAKHAAKPD